MKSDINKDKRRKNHWNKKSLKGDAALIKKMKEKEVIMPANLLKRAIAFIIDLAVIDVVVGFPFNSLIEKFAPKNPFELIQSSNPAIIKIGFVMAILAVLYFALLEYRIGQTIGKIVMNLYVENENKEKKFWQYIVRSVFMIPAIPFAFFWIIDLGYLAFTNGQTRFLEKISYTKTVMKVKI